MHKARWIAGWCLLGGCLWNDFALSQHQVALQGNDKLAVVEPDGKISWELPWGGIHDLHVLDNGNFMVQQGLTKIVEVDRQTREIVWSYDSLQQNGERSDKVEVHSFQPLSNGNILIAESGRGRLIEVDRKGKLIHVVRLRLNHPHPHMDTRLVRQLEDGTYLVCHEGDGYVRQYSRDGNVVWEFEVPLFGEPRRPGHGPEAFGNKVFGALQLANGNFLIATGNGHSVLEVRRDHEIVWKLSQHDLPGITLAWVTTLEVLPNGNYLIGNCHAGPGQPVLIELVPSTRQVVWRLDEHDRFGNNVSNSQVLDVPAGTRR